MSLQSPVCYKDHIKSFSDPHMVMSCLYPFIYITYSSGTNAKKQGNYKIKQHIKIDMF